MGTLLRHLALVALLPLMAAADEALVAPLLTDPASETFLFSIPAPRGLIVDRNGEVLAGNRVQSRAVLRLSQLPATSPEEAVAQVEARLQVLQASGFAALQPPSAEQIRKHWQLRAMLPLFISTPVESAAIEALKQKVPELDQQTVYLRTYPQGSTACHLIGYVSHRKPDPAGEIRVEEPLWARAEGTSGLEHLMENELAGEPGLLSLVFDRAGRLTHREIIRPPQPGKTLVLTLNLKMQQLAERILAEKGRPGAFVAMDAMTGDVLALASHPGYDLSQFVPGISAEAFSALRKAPHDPFFPRASAGLYPPGSVFKPVVALAALESGAIRGASTHYLCGPSLEIAGREFRNWSDDEYGYYNVHTALMRSCNTWFYQAALDTGGRPILSAAHAFGLGQKPIEWEGFPGGTVPEQESSPHGLANLAIGQGRLLVSPLQMARMMSGFANGVFLPKPRLIVQVQTADASPEVVRIEGVDRTARLGYASYHLGLIRDGLRDVVNGSRGTGSAARVGWPQVCGKTGTAQWSKDGKERTLAWFTGFVEASNPCLAFAVVCEGAPGENLFGGRNAAPMAGEWLRTIYREPKDYGVTPPAQSWSAPELAEEEAPPSPPSRPGSPRSPDPYPYPRVIGPSLPPPGAMPPPPVTGTYYPLYPDHRDRRLVAPPPGRFLRRIQPGE